MEISRDKRDYYSILTYLEQKAVELSDGRWTDFSEGDIGTVFLKLMSIMGDMNNYHIDRGVNELYLSNAVDRSSILSLCKLIGYEPRHYESAKTVVSLVAKEGLTVPDGTKVQKGTVFTTQDKELFYTTIDDAVFVNGICRATAYEGTRVSYVKHLEDISLIGQIFFSEYEASKNTFKVKIGNKEYTQVEDVRYSTGGLEYSVHMNEERYLYIQFPSYWKDYITETSEIEISFLVCNGEAGRIGENTLVNIETLVGVQNVSIEISGNEQSIGGYDPETVAEIKKSAPQSAKTMNTIVTLNDFKDVIENIEGVSDIVALDYNNPDSGLEQPDDAYKVLVYVLPEESDSILIPPNQWTPEQLALYDDYGVQPLTELGEKVREYIDARRLASIDITYVNVEVLHPSLIIDVYLDPDNIYFGNVSEYIKDYIVEKYKRGTTKIGQNFYASVLGSNILKNFDYIEYCEVRSPAEKIDANSKQFIDILRDNIQVNVNSI